MTKGYNSYCSRECANSSDLRIKKIKQTNLARYGTTCSLASKEIRAKVKQTNLEKYGAENVFASDAIKSKIRKTNLEKYGETNPAKSKKVKDKSKQTCLDKYGVEYSFQSKEMREKSKQTCLEKYGVDHPWKSSQLRQRQIEEFCKTNGLIPVSELKLYQPSVVLKHFGIMPIEYMTQNFIPNENTDLLIDYSDELLSKQGTVIERELDIWLSSLNINHTMRDFQ